MLLPLNTDRPLRRPTLITHVLIGLNVVVFLIEVLLQRFEPDLFDRLHTALWLHGAHLTPWSFITYQFLHADFLHLAGNMLFLFVFGPNLEDRLRRWWFLLFYLVGGAAAGGIHALWTPLLPVVGASGAISAVTGAFLVFFPRTNIKVFVFFFVIGVFYIPAIWFIGFQIFMNIFMQGVGAGTNVAHLAHLGGYAYGGFIAYVLLATGVVAREPYDLFSTARQARRRRAFKEITTRGHDPWAGAAPRRQSPRRESKPDPKAEEHANRRAEVSRLLASGDLAGAASAYRKLRADFERPLLSRDNQITLANYYFQQGEHADAAETYAIFLLKREKDHETPHIRLMLALLYARYLARPADARAMLHDLAPQLTDDAQRELAQTLEEELGAAADRTM